jgi:hypothetical protein
MADDALNGKYVTLVSGDGFEFVVLREATMISPAIKSMLGPGSTFLNESNHFPENVLTDLAFQVSLRRLALDDVSSTKSGMSVFTSSTCQYFVTYELFDDEKRCVLYDSPPVVRPD